MKWEFHPDAEQELTESTLRYESEIPGLGLRFAREVERVVELILEDPALGVRVQGEIRRFVLRRFPFSVVYAVASGTLYVLAIAHDSRRPGYWRTRSGG